MPADLWIWLVPTVAYVVGFMAFWRKDVYRATYAAASAWCHPHRIDGSDVLSGICIATLRGLMWPLFMCWNHVFARLDNDPARLLRVISSEPAVERANRLEREAKARERRVEQLEHELGIH